LAHSGAWRGVADLLGDRLTLAAPDMPSHGKSAAFDGGVGPGTQVFDAVVARIEAPVDVIGHSFGATVALRLAIEKPELVKSLSLYEPVAMRAAQEDAPEEVAKHEAHMLGVEKLYEQGDPEGAIRSFVSEWGDGQPWEALPDERRAQFAALAGFVVLSQPDVLYDAANILPRLSQIAVPTVVMSGTETPKVMGVGCDYIARQIRGARRTTVDGAGHMGAISHPQDVAREIALTIGI
jgi:pimeloyl-ACP methyl ester carboxylesterase